MSGGFSWLAYSGFRIVFRPWMNRHISGVSVALPRASLPDGIPLVLVANHVSWWDGFLLIELQRVLRPGAPFHTVMLESELAQSPFLRRIGAIGIDPSSSASILRAIRELSRRVKKAPNSMIFFFPQGRIWPSYRRPLGFRRGVEVFARVLGDVVMIPVAIHLEPLTRVAPHAFVRAGEPIASESGVTAHDLEQRVEAELERIFGFLAEHGEDAPRKWNVLT